MIIPVRRAVPALARAVEAAVIQGVRPERVIVVGDGEEALDGAALPAAVRRIVRTGTPGASAARNRGLEDVSTDHVLFLDADDLIEGPLIRTLAARMAERRADVGFGPMERREEGAAKPGYIRHPRFASADDLAWQWLAEGKFLNPASILWRTAFLRGIGGWDESLARNTDGELAVRAVLLGGRFVTTAEGRGVYVDHQGERMTRRTDTMESLVRAGEKLAALRSDAVASETKRRALAAYFYLAAVECDRVGEAGLAERAWRQGRALGLKLPGGRPFYRGVAALRRIRGGNLIWSRLARLAT